MSATEKLSITLPKDMAAMIRSKVQGGAYASNSEAIREALRLLQDHERARGIELEELRRKIAAARASDELIPADAVFDRLAARYAKAG
jgi:antitoxin ParD1/3/4